MFDTQAYSVAYCYSFSLSILRRKQENRILCTSIISLICLLVLVPLRTWPMRSSWRWARPSRWPISWLCRPRGPSSTRTPQPDSRQTWWRPDPANLCPDRAAVFGSQRWVGLRAAQSKESGNSSSKYRFLPNCCWCHASRGAIGDSWIHFSPDCSHLHRLHTHYCNPSGHLYPMYMFQLFSLIPLRNQREGALTENQPSNDMNKHQLYCRSL